MSQYRFFVLFATFFGFFLSGCGGGGSSSSNTTPVTPAPISSEEPNWQPGVFPVSLNFVNRCETPRTGIDPFFNTPYPDVAGSAFEEKLWLRSWTYETYLWFDEVADNNPDNFTVLDYFDQLRTEELSESGRPRDNFHFTQDTAEYNERTLSSVTRGYGISWEFVRSSPPREFIVRYTEPGSVAGLQNVPRGAVLTAVNGIDFIDSDSDDAITAINAALFPDTAGIETEFTFRQVSGDMLDVTLTSEEVDIVPVQSVQVLDTAAGKVGYMLFNSFITPSQDALISAFSQFATEGINELVLDLRYNGGGSLALASQIGYMIAGPSQTNNRVFSALVNNGKTGEPTVFGFYDREIDYDAAVFLDDRLPSPALTRVFVLSTEGTCSASEAVINGLRGIDVEVVLIGDVTCGKPYGFVPEDNCGTTYFTIQTQVTNNRGFGDYQEGFIPVETANFSDELPGCFVDDDLTRALGDTEEGLLSAALYYMENRSCPVVISENVQGVMSESASSQSAVENQRQRRRSIITEAIRQDNFEPIKDGQ